MLTDPTYGPKSANPQATAHTFGQNPKYPQKAPPSVTGETIAELDHPTVADSTTQQPEANATVDTAVTGALRTPP